VYNTFVYLRLGPLFDAQDKLAAISTFQYNVFGMSPASFKAGRAVTKDDLIRLTASLMLDSQISVSKYCSAVGCIAMHTLELGCASIIAANCIPSVVDCLRCWLDCEDVNQRACDALNTIALSPAARPSVASIPGLKGLLEAATVSRSLWFGGRPPRDGGYAGIALRTLGW
jgi:hypothetical protein